MKPKTCERLTQGLAIGAAVLALNGCDDPIKAAREVADDTREKAEKLSSEVDTRLRLNECLKKSHPERGINTELLWKDVSDLPLFILLKRAGFEPKIIGCSPHQAVINLKDCGMIMFKQKDLFCGDENADGVWERTICSAYNGDPTCQPLSPADRAKNPSKWKKYQDICDTAFNRCLDQ
jgi:hypothetical protein